MIERIATVPGTPLLIPEVASGAADELDHVRSAAVRAVSWAGGSARRVIVIAQDPSITQVEERSVGVGVDLSILGLTSGTDSAVEAADDHPCVSVLAGRWLAEEAEVEIERMWIVPANPAHLVDDMLPMGSDDSLGVVLIADGSSTRTPKAPGAFVDGAVEFDAQIAEALGTVDVGFFTDSQRSADCHRYQVAGLGPWHLASVHVEADGRPWRGEVDLTCDPYGVEYFVARWARVA